MNYRRNRTYYKYPLKHTLRPIYTKSVIPLYKTLQSKVWQGKYELCVIVHSYKVRKKHRKDLVQRIFLHTFALVILKTIFFTLNSLIPIEDLER